MPGLARKRLFEQLAARYPANKVREILLAAEGLKVARTLAPEEEVADFVRAMTALGLYAALYHRKYVCQPDAGKGGWISRHGLELELEAAPAGLLMVYLADNPTAALRAMEAEHAHADADFGDLLGIPACCSAFYAASIAAAEQEQNDFILPVLGPHRAGLALPPRRQYRGAVFRLLPAQLLPLFFPLRRRRSSGPGQPPGAGALRPRLG